MTSQNDIVLEIIKKLGYLPLPLAIFHESKNSTQIILQNKEDKKQQS